MSRRRLGPTVRLRRLAADLRQLRESNDLTREEVTARTSINAVTLYRIETARARPQVRTLRTLLDLYGVPEPRRAELVTLSREADQRGWLRSFSSVLGEHYTTYIGFESEAERVENYESLYVPGLLQTERYAMAAVKAGLPSVGFGEVETRARARMERQKLLRKESPLRLRAVVAEAVLRCRVGGAEVVRDQLEHIVEVSAMENVLFQVIPFQVGAHPGMQGSFAILRFPQPDPAVVYLDSVAGEFFLESEAEIDRYSLVFEYLRSIALNPEDSRALTAEIARKT